MHVLYNESISEALILLSQMTSVNYDNAYNARRNHLNAFFSYNETHSSPLSCITLTKQQELSSMDSSMGLGLQSLELRERAPPTWKLKSQLDPGFFFQGLLHLSLTYLTIMTTLILPEVLKA